MSKLNQKEPRKYLKRKLFLKLFKKENDPKKEKSPRRNFLCPHSFVAPRCLKDLSAETL